MENKASVTPELKEIYNRVMETSTKTQLPTETPNPADVATTTTPNQLETNMPNSNIETSTQNIVANTQPSSQIPNQAQPQQTLNQTMQQPQTQNLASMAGTVRAEEPRKSKKPLFIVLSTIFIILWAGFWAMFFGLISI